MPKIVGYVPVINNSFGFMLPIGRDPVVSNQDLIQIIDRCGVIKGFSHALSPHIEFLDPALHIEVDQGEEACWIFRAPNGQIAAGVRLAVCESLRRWSRDGLFDSYPLLAYEVEYFSGNADPEVSIRARLAFDYLKEISVQSALIWRDTEIFLPAVRQDVMRHYRDSKELRPDLANIELVTLEHASTVYLPERLYDPQISLPFWDYIRTKWNIGSFSIERKHHQSSRSSPFASWILLGQGSVGRRVVMSQSESLVSIGQEGEVAIVKGPAVRPDSGRKFQILIAILSGGLSDVRAIETASLRWRHKHNKSHAVFVRPFGFGVPSKGRPSMREVRSELRSSYYFWSVHHHRNVQTGGTTPGLAALQRANRNAAAVSTVLREFPEINWNAGNDSLEESSLLGATGIARFRINNTFEQNLKIAVGSILDPEISPTKSTIIYCFVPRGFQTGSSHISLGGIEYFIELIERRTTRRIQEVVLFGTNMTFATDVWYWYFRYCLSMVESYTTIETIVDNRYFDAIIGEKIYRIYPIFDGRSLLESGASSGGREKNMIYLTRSSIKDKHKSSLMFSRGIFHYSLFSQWFSQRGSK